MLLLTWMLQNTIAAACLALVVAATCRAFRLSPAVRHGLWLVVLFKLITPPIFDVPVPLPVLSAVPGRPPAEAPAVVPAPAQEIDQVSLDSEPAIVFDGGDSAVTESEPWTPALE